MKKLKGKSFSAGLALASSGFLFFCVILFSAFLTTTEKQHFLILAVYDSQAAQNHIVHIRKVSFTNGNESGIENVMDVVTQGSGDRVPKIRFDLGPNQVYRNRWIITSYGNVIDLQQKKILVDTHDQFVKVSGDSIVFFTNDIIRGKFYSVLDLKTGNYAQVKDVLFKAIAGKDVEPDCSAKNYKIYFYPPSAPKVELVRDAGYGEDISLIPGARSQCPLFWIDNDNFIYPNYSVAHDYVSINKVCVSTKEQTKIGEIDHLPENHELSRFYKDIDGEIIYSCARGQFKIEPAKNKVTELEFLSAGNGFSVSVNEVDKKGRQIRSGDQVVGTYFCFPELAATTPGFIAFPYEIALGDEHYLQGAAVYSASSKQWKTIGDSDLSAVIGWIEE
ncbi:MAG TPA: hypothetical protein VFJ43_01505 [Bacteroidia bacterium]|nr:hypothetical protein [Bacteroidia bacterium]